MDDDVGQAKGSARYGQSSIWCDLVDMDSESTPQQIGMSVCWKILEIFVRLSNMKTSHTEHSSLRVAQPHTKLK